MNCLFQNEKKNHLTNFFIVIYFLILLYFLNNNHRQVDCIRFQKKTFSINSLGN